MFGIIVIPRDIIIIEKCEECIAVLLKTFLVVPCYVRFVNTTGKAFEKVLNR